MRIRGHNIEVHKVIEELQNHGFFYDCNPNLRDNYMVTCPFHNGGMEEKPSFGIHKETGQCKCFQGECNYTGNLITLAHDLLGVDGADWLIETFIYGGSNTRPIYKLPTRGCSSEEISIPLDVIAMTTKDNSRSLEYLSKRGIIGVDKIFPIGYNKLRDSVMFFIRRIDGSIAYIKERGIESRMFHNTANADKKQNLFGIYEVVQARAKVVWVCESETDALTLWSWGVPAIAIGGASISDEQLNLLRMVGIRTLIDGLDRDKAGRAGFKYLQGVATGFTVQETVWNTVKKDINELTPKEFKESVDILGTIC